MNRQTKDFHCHPFFGNKLCIRGSLSRSHYTFQMRLFFFLALSIHVFRIVCVFFSLRLMNITTFRLLMHFHCVAAVNLLFSLFSPSFNHSFHLCWTSRLDPRDEIDAYTRIVQRDRNRRASWTFSFLQKCVCSVWCAVNLNRMNGGRAIICNRTAIIIEKILATMHGLVDTLFHWHFLIQAHTFSCLSILVLHTDRLEYLPYCWASIVRLHTHTRIMYGSDW